MADYTTFSHKKSYNTLIDDCIKLYREHHPELDQMEISKNKILFEMIKFYLQGTKFDIKKNKVFNNEI